MSRIPNHFQCTAVLLFLCQTGAAGVLPDDRSDILYHQYDGGGVQIDGPSILVRKSVGKNISLAANYYVDMVSSASIDVITTASPYTEERTQYSLTMDYLRGNTTMSAGFTSSAESDFDASSYNLSIAQDMFGDLTTYRQDAPECMWFASFAPPSHRRASVPTAPPESVSY